MNLKLKLCQRLRIVKRKFAFHSTSPTCPKLKPTKSTKRPTGVITIIQLPPRHSTHIKLLWIHHAAPTGIMIVFKQSRQQREKNTISDFAMSDSSVESAFRNFISMFSALSSTKHLVHIAQCGAGSETELFVGLNCQSFCSISAYS